MSRSRTRRGARILAAAVFIAAATLPASVPGLRSPSPVLAGSGGCSPSSSTCYLFDVTLGGSGFGSYRTRDENGGYTGRINCHYGNETQTGTCGWGYEQAEPGQQQEVHYSVLPDPGSQICPVSFDCLGPNEVLGLVQINGNFADIQWRFELIRAVQIDVLVEGTGSGTVKSDPPGIACPDDCDDLFPEALPVTLTAKPSAGSIFARWEGDCTGTNATCVVAPEFLLTVTAVFNKKATPKPPTEAPATDVPTDEPTEQVTPEPTTSSTASESAIPTEPAMSVSSTLAPSADAGRTDSPSTTPTGSVGTLPIVAALAIALVILVGGAVFFARRGRSPAG